MDSNDENYQDDWNDRGNPNSGAVQRQNNRLPGTNNVVSPDSASGAARDPDTFTGFTRVAPNETKHRQLQMNAQKEEEELQRFRASLRAVPINEPPELLGGSVSMEEVRQRQQANLNQSRLQKRMKKEDMDRQRRAEEEEENQRWKREQRGKAELHERRTQQQEQARSRQLRPEQLRVTESFLQKLQREGSAPASPHRTSQTHSLHQGGEWNSGWGGAESSGLHLKKTTEQTLPAPQGQTLQDDPRGRDEGSRGEQADHRMLNSAFLDRLEKRGREGDSESRESRRSEPPQRSPAPPAPPTPAAPPPQSDGEWPELAAELQAESEWALCKLEVTFPECNRRFLEDILTQCDGDYHQAEALLRETMS